MPDRYARSGDVIDRTPDTVVLSKAQERWSSWMIDLLIYTIVLNLFDEYVHGVEIESFTISILTAFLLKVIEDAVDGPVACAASPFGDNLDALGEI